MFRSQDTNLHRAWNLRGAIGMTPHMEAEPRAPFSLSNFFAIDLRSLAAFRVGLGMAILIDLAFRARFFSVFYTNQGVVPMDGGFFTCIHAWNGSTGYAATLFG